MPRKKVIKEIPLNSDDDYEPTTYNDSATVEQPAAAAAANVAEPASHPISATPPPSKPTAAEAPPPAPVKKKAMGIPQRAVTQKRLESLRAANEARLRQKIERELLEKKRRDEEQERMLEQKMRKIVEETMKAREKPQVKNNKFRLPPPAMQNDDYGDDDDDYEDDYADHPSNRYNKAPPPSQRRLFAMDEDLASRSRMNNGSTENPLFGMIFGGGR